MQGGIAPFPAKATSIPRLRALNNSLRPKASAADGEIVIAKAILFIGLGEVAAAAEGAWRKHKIMQPLTIINVDWVKPQRFYAFSPYVSYDCVFDSFGLPCR